MSEYSGYGKCPKILNALFHTFSPFCFLCSFSYNLVSRMANSVVPDQTVPSGAV